MSLRARREIRYRLVSVPLGVAGCAAIAWLLGPSLLVSASVVGTVAGLLGVVLALRLARRLGGLYRRAAARLLDEQIAAPPPFRRPAGSIIVRLGARLRDGAAWRAIGYTLLKLPLAFSQYLALAFWACGLAGLICPLWWPIFRNHPAGTTLSPVAAATPPPFSSFVHATNGGGTACSWPFSARRVAALAAPPGGG